MKPTMWGLLLLIGVLSLSAEASLERLNNLKSPFVLDDLPYAANSLDPYIDQETMTLHHDKHHQAYVKALNENLKEKGVSLMSIFKNVSDRPAKVRNNAGGHWNHTFFWDILSSDKANTKMPSRLTKEIEKTFGSMKKFKKKFEEAGKGQFGSGWVWLIRNTSGKLQITSTPNQDNPLMNDVPIRGFPVLGADVWEHAYYLKYRNKRDEYLNNFWKVVNWKKVDELNEEAKKMKLE